MFSAQNRLSLRIQIVSVKERVFWENSMLLKHFFADLKGKYVIKLEDKIGKFWPQ